VRSISVGVVVHSGKTFGGGLDELRRTLAEEGHAQPIWYEVAKSSKARKAVRRAVDKGATLLFVWGGDGMVQRCIDAVRDLDVAIAILPAGTGNLLATDLGIPKDIRKAVDIGLNGERRKLDVGTVNGERFAAMAGTGFDAIMIRDTSDAAKEELGRLAYFRSSVKALRARSVRMRIRIDGAKWFKGKATCALIGNIGRVTGGVPIFPDASPFDGQLDVGVVTAKNVWQWLRVFLEIAKGGDARCEFVERTRARKIDIKLRRARPYELDGSSRPRARRLKVRVEAGAVTLCVPGSGGESSG
jgi:diacylglycerol kinase (ATP)